MIRHIYNSFYETNNRLIKGKEFEMEGTKKIFSKRFGMRAYGAYIEYLIGHGIPFREEEDTLTITVYI